MTIVACVRAASWPPFSQERCFRTALISRIVAPPRRSSLVVRCLSASVTPGSGAGKRLDAPPDRSTSSRSRELRPRIRLFSCTVARSPARSGMGWPASTTLIRLVGARCPDLTTTSPSSNLASRSCSIAWAIRAEALPAPTAITRSTRLRS